MVVNLIGEENNAGNVQKLLCHTQYGFRLLRSGWDWRKSSRAPKDRHLYWE